MALSIHTCFLIVLHTILCTLAHSRIYNLDFTLAPQSEISVISMNSIDSCWRFDEDWNSNRFTLADCARGFGSEAGGGKHGTLYTVVDPSDDPVHPKPGTLRYGTVQHGPVWITFKKDMVITLKNELTLTSKKTIDGRGANVEITNGPCLRVQDAKHVIIHGIRIHGCKRSKPGLVQKDTALGPHEEDAQDGDAIPVENSSHVWIDHCYLASSDDGLVDITHGSTYVTVSNNYFTNHNKVMLLGHSDTNPQDKNMKITIAFNHFGPGLVQRMPRVRFGYVHVANNKYDGWGIYAIGGSSNPTIISEGNYFVAPKGNKQVTWREPWYKPTQWKVWEWTSSKDVFVNDAYFVSSGDGNAESPNYSPLQSFKVLDGSLAPSLTADAGPLRCSLNKACVKLYSYS